MTREQAKKEAELIFLETNKKCDEIEKEAKENGKWLPGLDANRHLFKKVHDEAKKRLKELEEQIDE